MAPAGIGPTPDRWPADVWIRGTRDNSVPSAITAPPIHSQRIIGSDERLIDTDVSPGSRPLFEGQVHILRQARSDPGVGTSLPHVQVRGDRWNDTFELSRSTRASNALSLPASLTSRVTDSKLEGVALPLLFHALFELESGCMREAVRRSKRNGDHDHAEVHDHPAVGSTHESAPALPAGGERELPQRSSSREPGQTERDQWRPARRHRPCTARHDDAAHRTRPARTTACAAILGLPCATAAPVRRAIRKSSTIPIGIAEPIEVGRAHDGASVLQGFDSSGKTVPSSTTKANTVNSTLFARKAPSRRAANRSRPVSAAGRHARRSAPATPPRSDRRTARNHAPDRPVTERVHRLDAP